MQDEIVFVPDRGGVSATHVVLISGGFFIFAELFFLDGLQLRMGLAAAYAVFLLLGFWFARFSSKWPQEIVINRLGIRYGNMKTRYGVELIPWGEVARMDLFYTYYLLPPHLRIGLRPGAFHEQVKKDRLTRLTMGLDVNVPVSVNVPPDVVLETAQRYWKAYRRSRS